MKDEKVELDQGGKRFNSFFKWGIIVIVVLGVLAGTASNTTEEESADAEYSYQD